MKLDKKTESRIKGLAEKRKAETKNAISFLKKFREQFLAGLAAPQSLGSTVTAAVPTATAAETGLPSPSSLESPPSSTDRPAPTEEKQPPG